jgi:toxin FitB
VLTLNQQAEKLQQWLLLKIKQEYSNKILPVDSDTSEIWGLLLAATDDTNAVDKLIAATALQYDLTLITRNIDHMVGTGAKCIDPFES